MLLAVGIGQTATRAVGAIWVNRRTTSDVRATVQSFLAQVQYGGEIVGGVAFGAFAQQTPSPPPSPAQPHPMARL